MALDTRTQKSLMEAAIFSANPKTEPVDQRLHEIAENFILSVIGNELNESTCKEDQVNLISNLIEETNILCYALNSYFNIH